MSIKVFYFDGYGRAEAIRLMLTYLEAPFEDIRLSGEEFAKLKAEGKFEFGQLPAVEWEGQMYTQSASILRALGANNGLYTNDPKTMWKIDSTIDALNDVISAYYNAAFNPNEDAKKAGLEKFYAETFPKFCERLENRIKNNSSQKHIVGDNWTIADFAVCGVAFSKWENDHNPERGTEKSIVEKYPVLNAYFDNAREQSKDYLASRKPSPW